MLPSTGADAAKNDAAASSEAEKGIVDDAPPSIDDDLNLLSLSEDPAQPAAPSASVSRCPGNAAAREDPPSSLSLGPGDDDAAAASGAPSSSLTLGPGTAAAATPWAAPSPGAPRPAAPGEHGRGCTGPQAPPGAKQRNGGEASDAHHASLSSLEGSAPRSSGWGGCPPCRWHDGEGGGDGGRGGEGEGLMEGLAL